MTKTEQNDIITRSIYKQLEMESLEFLHVVAQAIYDKKGANIIALDLRDVSTLTDFFIIAEGGVDRHVKALADIIQEEAQKCGIKLLMAEGEKSGDWCVLDFGSLIVHLFIPSLRQKYALENLWAEGKIVDLRLKISQD